MSTIARPLFGSIHIAVLRAPRLAKLPIWVLETARLAKDHSTNKCLALAVRIVAAWMPLSKVTSLAFRRAASASR